MTLQELLDQENCTEEEHKKVASYFMFLRMEPHLNDLKLLFFKLRNIWKP